MFEDVFNNLKMMSLITSAIKKVVFIFDVKGFIKDKDTKNFRRISKVHCADAVIVINNLTGL